MAQCPRCNVDDVIEIQQRLPDGTEVRFCSCHKCDEKWWDRNGEQLELADVLALVRKPSS